MHVGKYMSELFNKGYDFSKKSNLSI